MWSIYRRERGERKGRDRGRRGMSGRNRAGRAEGRKREGRYFFSLMETECFRELR